MSDRALEQMGDWTMPREVETRWPPLELDELHEEVRVVEFDTVNYDPAWTPPEPPEPEPIGTLRHRQTWAERHRQDVDDLRMDLGHAQMSLRDAIDGCKAVRYPDDVTDMIAAALDRTIEALRRIDIHDPE